MLSISIFCLSFNFCFNFDFKTILFLLLFCICYILYKIKRIFFFGPKINDNSTQFCSLKPFFLLIYNVSITLDIILLCYLRIFHGEQIRIFSFYPHLKKTIIQVISGLYLLFISFINHWIMEYSWLFVLVQR